MATMFENLQDLISPALVTALSRQTAESQAGVSKGLSAAIPAIASMIANRSNDQGFVNNLADLATRTAAGPDPLDAMSGLVSPPTGIDTTSPIGGWLSSLLGHNLYDVTDSLSRYAGIGGSSATSLLSIAAPLVLGYIGRLMKRDRLSAAGLADVLQGQRAELASSVPGGFRMPEVFRAPRETARTALKETTSPNWSAAAVALLAALCVGGFIWWARQKPIEVARVEVVEPMAKAVGTAGTLAGRFARTLPGNLKITIPAAGSAEDRLSTYLASAAAGATTANFSFDRIAFDSDSAVLSPESDEQVDNIATILRAYPRAYVTIAGHTDNVGNEGANLVLSRDRATAVAARLTALGVSSDRVQAVGYGGQKPVADNSTEAGRAQNRRVDLDVAVR